VCGGAQSPYLRAEVKKPNMEEGEQNDIANSSQRGEHVGEAYLQKGEWICSAEEDYIDGSKKSVVMHMRSVHHTEGSTEQLMSDVDAVTHWYRDNPLPQTEEYQAQIALDDEEWADENLPEDVGEAEEEPLPSRIFHKLTLGAFNTSN